MSPRVHNLVFALIVGVVFGATAWSVAARDPQITDAPSVSLPKGAIEAPVAIETELRMENGKRRRRRGRNRNRTERLIEQGELSDHPAAFEKKVHE